MEFLLILQEKTKTTTSGPQEKSFYYQKNVHSNMETLKLLIFEFQFPFGLSQYGHCEIFWFLSSILIYTALFIFYFQVLSAQFLCC